MRRACALIGLAVLCVALVASAEEATPRPADAEITDPDEQFWRGFNLLHGRGVAADPAASTEWFRRSAEQGQMRSQVHMGMAYLEGRGVEIDRQRAFEWFLAAADQGHPKAQLEAGILLVTGNGVPLDRVEGGKWLMLSVYAGGPMARAKVPHYLGSLRPDQHREAQARARAWRTERGLPVPEPKAAGSADSTDSTDSTDATDAPAAGAATQAAGDGEADGH